ncbi:ubiquitin domain-containing protein UBFD1 [Phlyctochytrium arcticum]|nr:ubiquitin domain-containing protein UBFD1 [Phlyctochytrium arcticum]
MMAAKSPDCSVTPVSPPTDLSDSPTSPGTTGTKRKVDRLESSEGMPTVTFKVVHGKRTYDVTFVTSRCVTDLKQKVEELTGIHANMQKLLFKGILKDDQTLQDANIKDGAKVMLMASKAEDVMKLATAAVTAPLLDAPAARPRTSLSETTEHKKILDKGKPDDAEAGMRGKRLPLPVGGVRSLMNGWGSKTRLTFKPESDEVWIGTNERTQKVGLGSIRGVTSEAIKGHEEYHILAFQLGPTEKSNYYLYWVPAQYVESIKDAILGPFQSWL